MRDLETMSKFEFNNVVKLYNQLSIDILSDIVSKIEKNGLSFDKETEFQLRKIFQLNGEEVFYQTLNKINKIEPKIKKELTKLFKTAVNNELNEYENLYKYRNKTLKISLSQEQIYKSGIKNTINELKLTNKKIAYESENLYNNLIKKAYIETITGAFTYQEAVQRAYEQVKKDGLTITSENGRKYQVDNVIRLNVFSQIRDTTNEINQDIEKELGCDGKEVTAHIGARPSHAEFQGKQFALNKEGAEKFNVTLWSEVESLWQEYYCRHTHFGIILGLETPVYNKAELKEIENAKVVYKNKTIPYYEATQLQRRKELEIRSLKRVSELNKNLEKDNTNTKFKLKEKISNYNNFCKELGLTVYKGRLTI